MSISQIAKSISESVTLKLNEKAAILREKGDPVIHLGGGEQIQTRGVPIAFVRSTQVVGGNRHHTLLLEN